MNEEALNEVFNLSLNAGYTKDLDAFRELMANNEEARTAAFDLSVGAGYTKDINAFSELMGVVPGKANVQSAGATVDGNQAPQGKDGTPIVPLIDINFLNRTEEDAITDLRLAYPELKFEQTGFGTDKISVGEGDNKVIFDFDNGYKGTKGVAAAKAMQLYLDGDEKGYKALMVAHQKAYSASDITESLRGEAEGETRKVYETTYSNQGKEFERIDRKQVGVEGEWQAFAKDSETMLQANRSASDPEITEEAIREQAIELYINNKRYAGFSSLVEEHLEEFGDIHDSKLFDVGQRMLANVIGRQNTKEMLAGADPQQQGRDALGDALGDVAKAKVAEVDELVKKLTVDRAALDGFSEFFTAPEPTTAAGVAEWNAQVELYKTAASSFGNNHERLIDMTVEAGLAEESADNAKRSYETLDVMGAHVFNSGARILAGTMELIDNVSRVVPNAMVAGTLEYQLMMDEQEPDSMLERGANLVLAAGNERMSVVAKPQSFEEFNSAEDILEWGLEMVSGQVPVLATAMIPYAGLAILGGSSMGSKMSEIDDRISKGEDISEGQRWGTGAVYGVSEIVTERVKLGQFKSMAKTLRGMKGTATPNMSTLASRWGLAGDVTKRWGIATLSEGGAEAVASLSQNIADIHILGDNKSYWEGVSESFFAGAVLSGGVFQSPALIGGVYDIAMTKGGSFKLNSEMQNNHKLEAEKQELIGLHGTGAQQPSEVKNRINEINSEQQDIIDRVVIIRNQAGEKIDQLSRREKRVLIMNDVKLWESKRKIKELQAPGNKLSVEKKQELITLEALKIKKLRDNQDRVLNDAAYSIGRDRAMKAAAASDGGLQVVETGTVEEAIKIGAKAIKDSDLSDSAKEKAIEELKEGMSQGFNGVAIPVGKTNSIIFGVKGGTNSAVWAHEVSHHALFSVLIKNNVDIIDLSKDLEAYMLTNIKGSDIKFAAVRKLHKNSPADELAEEILAAAVEMISDRNLDADKTLNAKFRDFRNVLAKAPVVGKYIKASSPSGKDVLSLLKEFNIAFESGNVKEFSEGLEENKLTKKYEAKGYSPSAEDRSVRQSKESKDLSKEVQAVWDRDGKDGGFEVSEMYRGMAITRAAKYRDLPLYSSNKDILVDEILTGKRGVYDIVQTYDPSKNDSLSAYINTFLPRRVIEVVNRVLGTEFTEDVTERKDIVAAPEATQIETDAPKVASVIRRKIGLDEKQMNIVRRAVIRALATAPKIKAVVAGKPKAFNDHLVKTYTTLLFKMLKNHMSTGADYRMWVKKNFDVFNNNVGLSTLINGRMDLFYKPVLNKTGTQERMSITEANDAGIPLDKAGAGPLKWQRISPTPAEFYDWAMGKGMAANTKPARKTTMARLLSREVGLDATMEVLNNVNQPDYTEEGIADSDKTVNMLERLGIANQNQMAETEVTGAVSASISRHRDLRFDKSNTTYQAHKTPSASYNTKVKAISDWYANNKKLKLLSDETIAKLRRQNKDLDNLYKAAIATARKVRIDTVKQDLKANGIESFIKQSVEARLKDTTLRRVFNSNVAQTTAEYKTVIDELKPVLLEEYGDIEAVVMIIRAFQPSGAQRGAKSPWQRNETFMAKVIAPMIKEYGLEGRITLGDPKLKDKNGNPRTGLTTFKLDGKKITPAIALEASQGIFLKALNGTLRGRDLVPFNKQARAHQAMITGLSTLMRGNKELSQKTKATFVWGLGNMTRGAGRLAYQYKGILRDGDIVDPLHYTVEHQLPWSEMAAYIALYIEGVIPKSELQSKWKTAELYLHPTGNAKVMNASGAMIYDKHEGAKNDAGLPKRLEDSKQPGQTFEPTRSIRYDKGLDEGFNNILEVSANMPANKIISPTEAIKRGRRASRKLSNQGIMISSAEDFRGLLYKVIAPGKVGEDQMDWLDDQLVVPYDLAVDKVSVARLNLSDNLRNIKKSSKLKSDLKAEAFDGMTGADAVRLYIWKMRESTKGKFVKDAYFDMAVDFMSMNPELKAYADAVHKLAGPIAYAAPSKRWAYGTIETDLIGGINGELRKLELEQWDANAKEIFSEDNLNKLEALYGDNYRKAVENVLERMRSGRNRVNEDSDKMAKKAGGWISNQVGAIMFLNMRSAALQLLSTVNFINTTDNNPLKAIARVLNTPQYIRDMRFILGSAFMRDRRAGMRIDVNEEDVAGGARESAKGMVSLMSRALKILLNKGFMPTRLMDTAAITLGGAGFYRNRINTYKDEGYSVAQAEKAAFSDFRQATINSQQSSDPRMVSQQQASTMGRFVLQFGNTPGQYTRIQIKALKDISNGRGDLKANIGKIMYYGILQNAMFTILQQALVVAFFDEDDEWIGSEEGRTVVDGMLSSTLRGLGVYGALIDVSMRTASVWQKEKAKGFMGKNEKVVIEALGMSPAVRSISRNIISAADVIKWREDEFGVDPYDLHSPEVEQAALIAQGAFNFPAKRILDKAHNIESIMSGQNEAWQNVGLALGWRDWQLGVGEAGEKAKERKLEKKGIANPAKKEKKRKKSISDMTDAEFKAWRIKNPVN